VVAYQTAYLMHYFPTEFIAAMLNSVKGDNEKVAYYIRFANEKGIQILPPDINESCAKFTVKENTIRFGLSAIKNVGENIIDSIVKSRNEKGNFIDISDFCNKIDISSINKRVVESLIKAGAFDCFGVYRSQMLSVYEKVLDSISNSRKKNLDGQISLFGTFNDENIKIQYPKIKEFEKRHILAMEKEMTGLYLSGHPLEEYEKTLKSKTSINISDILTNGALEEGFVQDAKVKDGDIIIIGGIITEITKKFTKNNDMMAFIRLEDLYGGIEVVVFPKTFQKFKNLVSEDALALIKGRVSLREEEQPKILCESIEPLVKMDSESLYILIEDEKELKEILTELKVLFLNSKGNLPVYLCTRKERKKFRLDREFWISQDIELMANLRAKLGDENVKII
jgi:DNA polymerase-3 subunit alpha